MWHSAKMKPNSSSVVGLRPGMNVRTKSMRAVSKKRRNSTLFRCCMASRSPKRTRWTIEKRSLLTVQPLRHLDARHRLHQEPEQRARGRDDRHGEDHRRNVARDQQEDAEEHDRE